MTKKQLQVFWLLLAFQVIFLLVFVFFRLVDADEGLYLEAARLVSNGKVPYLDFFHNQMPYLPYTYSPVSDFGFSSLFLGRLVSAIASVALGLLVFWLALRLSRSPEVSLLIFFLYGFHGLILTWHSTVKTSTLSDLWSFVSFVFFALHMVSRKQRAKNYLLLCSGIFAGLAFNFRLTHLVVPITEGLLILLLFSSDSLKRRVCNLLFLLLGVILSSCFAIYLFLRDPLLFVFDNLVFRQVWGQMVIKMSFMSRLFTLSKFLLYPQDLLILVLGSLSLAYLLRQRRQIGAFTSEHKVIVSSMSLALSIGIVSFLISPTQFQYFEQTLPFLLLACVPALTLLKPRWRDKKVIVPTAILYLLCIVPFIVIFILGIRAKDQQFTLKNVRKVVEVIRENSQPKDTVLSFAPLYVALSQREPVPGLEAWGGEAAPHLTAEQLSESKLISLEQVKEIVKQAQVPLVVAEEWVLPDSDSMLWIDYQLLGKIAGVQIYKRR
ncbi:MAG: hypothetical protein WCE90_10990 [Candidatus Zixiibacteriota bacterium]